MIVLTTTVEQVEYSESIPPSQESSIFAQPKVKQFYVAGIIELGYYEYDRIFSYISLEEAQKFFGMPDAVSWIEIKIDDYEKADEVAVDLSEQLGYPYTTLTWFEMNKSLFSWMQIEKWGAFVILSLIIMVAAFNIISSLIMVVMEKTREIGILKSMGATSKSIMKIFVFEGIKSGTTSYKPDFYIKNKDNICFWVECKGYMDSKSKTKLKRFLKYFKDEKIILITRNDIFEKIICDDIENLFLTKKMIF